MLVIDFEQPKPPSRLLVFPLDEREVASDLHVALSDQSPQLLVTW